MNFFKKLFHKNQASSNSSTSFRPKLEGLEDRVVPTITLANDGLLTVVGTHQADEITVRETEELTGYELVSSPWGIFFVPVYEDHVEATIRDANGNITEQESFLATTVDELEILGLNGNDEINNFTALPSLIEGGEGADTIYGGSSNDTIFGGNGSDKISGNNGHDHIVIEQTAYDDNDVDGGNGNDTYKFLNYQNHGDITIHDPSGIDTLDFSDYGMRIELNLGTSSTQEVSYNVDLRLTSNASIENAIGNDSYAYSYGDVLIGNALNNRLEGRGGNDTLEGRQGNDTLVGGTGSDTYTFRTAGLGSINLGTDRIEDSANSSNDTLNFVQFTRSGIDIDIQSTSTQSVGTGLSIQLANNQAIRNVQGTNFGDTILGNSLDNNISGYDGNDVIRGRNGNDVLSGMDGNDTISGGNGRDHVLGHNDDDVLYSDESWGDDDGQNDIVSGGSGYDTGNDDGWWYYDPF